MEGAAARSSNQEAGHPPIGRRVITFAVRILKQYTVPAAFGALFILLWQREWFHTLLNIKVHQLPLPTSIWKALSSNIDVLARNAGYTVAEALLGMLAGSLIGFAVALLATQWPRWGSTGLIFIAALNAVPIIALAPIMNLWFGDGLGSRVAVVTITTMAAMAFNAHRGLTQIDPLALDLMHSYGARKSEVFRYVRLPNCLPYLFTALKINATASMIGAIVSEFFYSSGGIGYLLSNSIKVAKMSMGWACIVVASAVGVILYILIEEIEKLAIRWHSSRKTST